MARVHIDSKVFALRELHSDLLSRDYMDSSILDRLASQANSILNGHKTGNSAVVFHLGSWCADFIGMDTAQIMGSILNLDQCQETIAKEHGYKNWSEVETLQGIMLDAEFEKSVDAVVQGDISQLQRRLCTRPELAKQRSQYGHRATLLHYIGANGVESYRQITPLNAAEVASCLIRAGADVNAGAKMYGGSTTALNLVLTSAHPHNAGIASEIAEVLRGAGAT